MNCSDSQIPRISHIFNQLYPYTVYSALLIFVYNSQLAVM